MVHRKRSFAVLGASVVAAFAIATVVFHEDAPAQIGGGGAPQWELEVRTYPALATPVELPVGRVISTESAAEKKIRIALGRQVDFEFLDTQLEDVVALIRERYDIDVVLDVEALAADGKGRETPLTGRLQNMTLHNGLRNLFRGQGFTYLVKNDALIITTIASSYQPENLILRVYEVQDLVVLPNDAAIRKPKLDELIEVLQTTIRPTDWQDNGGTAGSVKPYEGPGILALAIVHAEDAHREIEQLFNTLRKAKSPELLQRQGAASLRVVRERLAGSPATTEAAAEETLPDSHRNWPDGQALPSPSEAERLLLDALDQPAAFTFHDVPLGDVAKHVAAALGRAVLFDHQALDADARGAETPMNVDIRHGTMRSILRQMLDQQGMTYLTHEGSLVFTTKSGAAQPENFQTRVYQVHDLIQTPQATERTHPDFEPLIELLMSVCSPADWLDNGGTLSHVRQFVGPGSQALVVTAPREKLEEVEQAFNLLRGARVQQVLDAQGLRRTLQPTSIKIYPLETY